MYLTADQVEGIAADLHAIPTFQLWALELMSPALLKRLKPTLGKHLAEAGMPFQWGPAEGPAFFNPFGWKELVVRSMFHEAGNHKRLTFPMNLFWYLPEPRPPWSKPWAGVCLFERSRA